jgi:hypothetical protein
LDVFSLEVQYLTFSSVTTLCPPKETRDQLTSSKLPSLFPVTGLLLPFFLQQPVFKLKSEFEFLEKLDMDYVTG